MSKVFFWQWWFGRFSPRHYGCYNNLYHKQNPISCSPLHVLHEYAKNRKGKGFFQGDLFPNRNRKLAQKGPKYVASIFDSLAIKDFWIHVHAHLVAHVSTDCKTIITILISSIFEEIWSGEQRHGAWKNNIMSCSWRMSWLHDQWVIYMTYVFYTMRT